MVAGRFLSRLDAWWTISKTIIHDYKYVTKYRIDCLQKCQNCTGPTKKRKCLNSVFSQKSLVDIIEFIETSIIVTSRSIDKLDWD